MGSVHIYIKLVTCVYPLHASLRTVGPHSQIGHCRTDDGDGGCGDSGRVGTGSGESSDGGHHDGGNGVTGVMVAEVVDVVMARMMKFHQENWIDDAFFNYKGNSSLL